MFQALICDRKRKEKHFLLKLGAQRDSVFKTIKHKSAKKAQKYISSTENNVQKGSIQPELNLKQGALQKESREQGETFVPLIYVYNSQVRDSKQIQAPVNRLTPAEITH